MKKENGLSPKQVAAIAALISGMDFASAAASAEVTPDTLRRWRRNDDAFNAEWRFRKQEMLAHTTSQISNAAVDSINVMKAVRDDVNETGSTRVKAASKLVDLAIQIGEMEVMQAEIDELRARLDSLGA